MERTKQKSKKDKPNKYLEKEKSSSFISDVKAFKENLKITEILKTVKMNSSMRIKAPRGSKVMQNKDFNDNEDIFDDVVVSGGQQVDEPPSATNTVLNNKNEDETVHEESIEEEKIVPTFIDNNTENLTSKFQKSRSSECVNDCSKVDFTPNNPELQRPSVESVGAKSRDRKLSLDHTMLLRREGFSQSEVDLNSIGKSPLERKSSFFRKKMDSFVRNTTEIFKRQSMNSKSTRSPVISRRDSTSSRMSVSLQSLNEDSTLFEEFKNVPLNTYRDQQSSVSSLASPRTDSTLSNENDRLLEQAEVDTMAGSPLPEDQRADTPSTSTYSLNKEPIQDSLLSTRAISMSSGLDTATGQRRRKTSKSNRVSWLASDSLTDYFRRLIQDEKSKDIQGWQSYQDFSAIPEHRVGSNVDSKGRRLSYMRAVSGEDPSLAASFRKKKLMESEGQLKPLERALANFLENGIPQLGKYGLHELPEEAQRYLHAAVTEEGFIRLLPRRGDTTPLEATQQAILQELVVTEAQYIKHIQETVEVYMATALALQDGGFLLEVNFSIVFTDMPDIYNSSIHFWEYVIYPMLHQAIPNGSLLDPKLMISGLFHISEILRHYEEYMLQQTRSTEYLREMNLEPDFACYINWCNQYTNNRLQLQDMLIKPLQRLTKYSLLFARLIDFVEDEDTVMKLKQVERLTKSFVTSVNRAVRQKEEKLKLDQMRVDPYEPEYKGEDVVEKLCKRFATIDLHQPMIGCGSIRRCLIHQGMVRFKDSTKEFDACLLLFTDVLLVCKKMHKKEKDKDKFKKEYTYWKMLRPKIMMDRLLPTNTKTSPTSYILLDELGSSVSVIQISESSKDSLGLTTAKMWGMKIFEAMVTYALTKWYVDHPPTSTDEIVNPPFSNQKGENKDIEAVEKRSRERVAAMLYKKNEGDNEIQACVQELEFQFRLLAEYAKHYDTVAKAVAFCPTYSGIYTEQRVSQPESETKPMISEGTPCTASVPAVTPRRRSSMAAAILNGLKGPINKDANTERRASQAETKSMISEGTVSYSSLSTVSVPVVTMTSRSSSVTPIVYGKKGPVKDVKNLPPNIYDIFETGISHKPQPLSTTYYDTTSSTGSSMMPSTSEVRPSTSPGSLEEPRPVQRSGSSLERSRPSFFVEDLGYGSPAINVNMFPANNSQTSLLSPRSARTPTLVLQESSPNHSSGSRSVSAGGSSDNTLRVASDVTLVHSMPDINTEIRRVLSMNLEPRPIPLTASERLYRSHQELMHKNRLAAGQHYLKPDNRGSSYPPPSPRALQRGDAVSFSFRYPPLTRDKNVPERASTSQLDTSPSRVFGRRSPQSDRSTGAKSPRRQRSSSPIPRAVRPPGEKVERKSLFSRRTKDPQYLPKNDERNADDRSRRSSHEIAKREKSIAEHAGST